MEWKQKLINIYIERKAIMTGTFKLTGGGTSNVYIDGRLVTTYPESLILIADKFAELLLALDEYNFDLNIVVPPLSGIPIAAVLSTKLNIPFIMDRGKAKQHGAGKRYEGQFSNNPNCVVIDDLITQGSTLLQSIQGLREIDKTVNKAFVVVDREEGARELLAKNDIELISLIKKSELLTHLENAK